MELEKLVEEIEKKMVISDVHIPFEDKDAVSVMQRYTKDYKPDVLYINGDLVDFYSLSSFDKSPDRKETVVDEVHAARAFLHDMRRIVGPDCKIVYLEGNHEARLQKYFWRNGELYGLDTLDIANLLELAKYNVEFVRADPDYWGKDTGHVEDGDSLIMHGDCRLNGAKGGIHGSYNTMKSMGVSTTNGHDHKLGLRFFQNSVRNLTALGTGCLCQTPGNADYEQGFATYSTIGGVNCDHRLHRIYKGRMIADGNIYSVEE